jgi:hypothetical protein
MVPRIIRLAALDFEAETEKPSMYMVLKSKLPNHPMSMRVHFVLCPVISMSFTICT